MSLSRNHDPVTQAELPVHQTTPTNHITLQGEPQASNPTFVVAKLCNYSHVMHVRSDELKMFANRP